MSTTINEQSSPGNTVEGNDRPKHRVSHGTGLAGLLALAVLASLFGMASPASADAKGCTPWGARVLGGIPVPAGTFCTTVVGSRTTVSGVQSEFYSPRVCNWEVTAEFFNSNWAWKKTLTTRRNTGCSFGTAWAPYIPVNKTIKQLTGTASGYMCSTLKTGGQRVQSHCHYIH